MYTVRSMKITATPHKRTGIIIFCIIFVVVVAGAAVGAAVFVEKTNGESTTGVSSPVFEVASETEKPSIPKIHISAMGDMLAHDSIIANAKTSGGYDFAHFFTNIRSSYGDADAVFCNQEGLSAGAAYGISGYPSFNAPTQYSAGLQSGLAVT
jgi:hypothetical protein